MTASSELDDSKRRLYSRATYLIDRLVQLDDAYRDAEADRPKIVVQFDELLLHVILTQKECAQNSGLDDDAAVFCVELPDAAAHLINLRVPARMRIEWLQTALRCAQFLKCDEAPSVYWRYLGNAWTDLSEIDEAISCYRQAEKLLQESDPYSEMPLVLSNLAKCLDLQQKHLEAERIYRTTISQLANLGDEVAVAQEQNNLGMSLFNRCCYEEATELFEQAIETLENHGEPEAFATTLRNLGNVLLQLGKYDDAAEHFHNSLGIARKVGDVALVGCCLFSFSEIELQRNDFEKALELAESSRRILEEQGDKYLTTQPYLIAALANRMLDLPQAAKNTLDRLLEIAREMGCTTTEARAISILGLLKSDHGMHHESLRDQEKAIAIYGDGDDLQIQGMLQFHRAIALYGVQRRHDAITSARRAVELLRIAAPKESLQVEIWIRDNSLRGSMDGIDAQ